MKILHLHLNGPFTENWNYQENLLTDAHAKMLHEVTLITTCYFHKNEGLIDKTNSVVKKLRNGVNLVRLKEKKSFFNRFSDVFKPYQKVLFYIMKTNPDFIIIHGLLGSISITNAFIYKLIFKPKCKIVMDIHEDYFVSPEKKTINYKILRFFKRFINYILINLTEKVYYVAPSSKSYAIKYYKILNQKLALLPLTADFNLIKSLENKGTFNTFRKLHNLQTTDLVICHGGKLDKNKKTIETIKAFLKLNKKYPYLKLILFGPILSDIKNLFFELISFNKNILYLGFQKPIEYYSIFLSSDIAIFPGGQSSLWQEAMSCGLAMVVKNEELEYFDLGGNVKLLENSSIEEIYDALNKIIENNQYLVMKKISKDKSIGIFSTEAVAKKILEFS
jgi:glycosyltransferase involved in cell wall biosynthesis